MEDGELKERQAMRHPGVCLDVKGTGEGWGGDRGWM